jgi:hypothetical protein
MDGNDFIQSIFTSERHRQFDLEVEKDRLAKLASPRVDQGRLRRGALRIWTLMQSPARRRVQRREQRAPMSIR